MNGRAIANLGAGVTAAVNGIEQRTHLVQAEAQFPAPPDEAEPLQV
jgi:hypothetical protein